MESEWSLVLPVRDEINLFRRAFPSCLALEPSELVLVLDSPGPRAIVKSAREMTDGYDGNLRIIEVPRDPSWNFHQAHVRRAGYLAAEHEKIFTCDADTILTRNVLLGLKLIGRDNVALISFSKFLDVYSPSNFVRALGGQVRRYLAPSRFSGLYWIYRPYYLDLLEESTVKQIHNGEDNLLLSRVLSSPKYRHVHINKIGCVCIGVQNEDYPWRQFQRGIWYAKRRRGLLKATLDSVIRAYPHLLRGYFYGKRRPDLLSRIPTYDDLVMMGRVFN